MHGLGMTGLSDRGGLQPELPAYAADFGTEHRRQDIMHATARILKPPLKLCFCSRCRRPARRYAIRELKPHARLEVSHKISVQNYSLNVHVTPEGA
jgi:hypothetical protein